MTTRPSTPSCSSARLRPWFARKLKERSSRPPMSVTRPTLIAGPAGAPVSVPAVVAAAVSAAPVVSVPSSSPPQPVSATSTTTSRSERRRLRRVITPLITPEGTGRGGFENPPLPRPYSAFTLAGGRRGRLRPHDDLARRDLLADVLDRGLQRRRDPAGDLAVADSTGLDVEDHVAVRAEVGTGRLRGADRAEHGDVDLL